MFSDRTLLLSVTYLPVVLLFFNGNSARVSPQNSIVYGPGLDSGFNVPARYFFIQAVDQDHKK